VAQRLFSRGIVPGIKTMKTHRRLFAAFAAALLTTASAWAADPSGTWTWTRQNRDGQSVEVTGKLRYADGKLTGTISGYQGTENPISSGKVEGDRITFDVVLAFNDNKFTIAYQGKLEGDAITGTITRPRRDGGTTESEWKATRKKS
jgi:hypothetical protein